VDGIGLDEIQQASDVLFVLTSGVVTALRSRR
jgi:hypothetical protein